MAYRIDRLNGQNYSDNLIDPLLANDNQTWTTIGTGTAVMSDAFVFQGKKSLKIQNNVPTSDLTASNKDQNTIINASGTYGLSIFILKNEPNEVFNGNLIIYQNATPLTTQSFELGLDSDENDLNEVWVRFDTSIDLELVKDDILSFDIRLDGIVGSALATSTIYVDGIMLYAKDRLNAMPPSYVPPTFKKINDLPELPAFDGNYQLTVLGGVYTWTEII